MTHFCEGWYTLQKQERQARQRRRWLVVGAVTIVILLAIALLWPTPAAGQGLLSMPPSPMTPAAPTLHQIYLPLVMRGYSAPAPVIDPRIYGLGIQVIRGCNPVGQEYFRLARVGLRLAAEGGDRMVRFQVLDLNGQPVADKVACLSSAWDRGCVVVNAETDLGQWAGVPMTIGYIPAYGPGPYAGSICGLTDFLIGMGLPDGEDISLFLTFQIEGTAE